MWNDHFEFPDLNTDPIMRMMHVTHAATMRKNMKTRVGNAKFQDIRQVEAINVVCEGLESFHHCFLECSLVRFVERLFCKL